MLLRPIQALSASHYNLNVVTKRLVVEIIQGETNAKASVGEIVMLRMSSGGAVAAAVALFAPCAWANGFYVSGSVDGVFRDSYSTQGDAQVVVPATPVRPFASAMSPAGIVITPNPSPRTPTPVPVFFRTAETTHYKAGGEVDAAGGYRFDLGGYGAVRMEAEVSFRNYQIGDSTVRSLSASIPQATYHATTATVKGLYEDRYAETLNTFYDLPAFRTAKFGTVTPYLGGGVGYQEGVQISGDRLTTYEATVPATNGLTPARQLSGQFVSHDTSGSSDDGTWLVEGGLTMTMSRHLDLIPSYRYTQAFKGHQAIKLMRLGMRYSF